MASSTLSSDLPSQPAVRRRRLRRSRSRRARPWLFRLAALALSLALGITAAELALRLAGMADHPEWGQAHPLWHHGYVPGRELVWQDPHGEFGGHRVHFNDAGLAMEAGLPGPDEPVLVVLGDSFSAGLEVSEDERYISRLARHLGVRAVNFGCGGFSPLLSRIQFEHYVSQLHPVGVVLQLSTDDVEGDLAKHALAQRDPRGRVVAVPPQSPALRWVRHSRILRLAQRNYRQWEFETAHRARVGADWDPDPWSPFFHRPLDEWYTLPERRPIESSIVEIATLCRERQIPLWLVAIPDRGAVFKGRTDYFSEYFLRFARQHQVATVDLEGPFRQRDVTQLYFRLDGHLTPAGHQLVGETLAPALEKGLAERTPVTAAGL